MFKRIVVPILIIAIAVLLYFVLILSKLDTPSVATPEKMWRVHTLPVNLQTISPEITIYGRVETPRKATLKSAMVADVLQADVLEGMAVKQGQELVRLDDTDAQIIVMQRQAELSEVEAQVDSEIMRAKRDKALLVNENKLLNLAENAVARANKLEKSKLASQANADDAMADMQRQSLTIKRLRHDISDHPARLAALKAKQQRAKSLLEQATVDLQRTIIKAPFSGRIAKLNVASGDRVRAGDSLITLYDLAGLEVRAQIPGRYMSQIQNQLQSDSTPKATAILEGKSLTFELVRLSGEIRQDSGGVDGLFRLSESMNTLALGSFVELKLQLAEQANLIAIPFDALYEFDRVYRLNEGRLEAVVIKRVGEFQTGEGEQQLLIRSASLTESDQIVSTQLPNAITGLRVEPVK